MARGIKANTLKRSIGQVLTLVLLVLYVVGSSNSEFLHAVVHPDEVVVTHSQEQEKDPCHRWIYHNDSEHSSEHESHLTVSDKCQMCDIAYRSDQVSLSNIEFASQDFFENHFVFHKLTVDSYCAILSSSRAPPIFI